MTSHFLTRHCIPLLVSIGLCGCAAIVPVEQARLAPLSAQASVAVLVLSRSVEVRLSTGYGRVLPAGSRWKPVGVLPQGMVYQRLGDVFSIEGRHVHEAYLVVKSSVLQGFYLPGESSFSRLNLPVSLPLGAS
jgi:hypothetical protein